MASTADVFQKSALGAEALAKRSPALTPKLRSVLIFVDGKRPVSELSKLAQGLGDPLELLGQLAQLGFIEHAAGAVSAPAPLAAAGRVSAPAPLTAAGRASAPAPLAETPVHTVSLLEAQRFAVRKLSDLLGPSSESLCLRIEGTRNAQDFAAAIQRAEAVLRDARGGRMATDFMEAIRTHWPA